MDKPGNADRRKYPRIRTDAVMAIRRVEDAAKLAHAVDLSIGGIRFQCVGLELELGDTIEVTFNLGDRTTTVVGRTLRLTDLDAFTQEVALGFVEVDPEVLERFYDLGLGDEEPQV
jgi:glutamate formiminotransferase